MDSDSNLVRADDSLALARLMDVSYLGTIDYEGETLDQSEGEKQLAFAGFELIRKFHHICR